MNEPDHDANALFEAGRRADLPSAADRQRVRAKLSVAIVASGAALGTAKGAAAAIASSSASPSVGAGVGAGMGAGGGATAGAAGALTATTGGTLATSALALKVVAAVAVVSAVGLGANALLDDTRVAAPAPTTPVSRASASTTNTSAIVIEAPPSLIPTPAPSPTAAAKSESASPLGPRTSLAEERGAPLGSEPRSVEPVHTPPTQPAHVAPRAQTPYLAPAVPAKTEPEREATNLPKGAEGTTSVDTLARSEATLETSPPKAPSETPVSPMSAELALLREAHAALDRGEGQRALALLDAHGERFPRAALAEEREAARVFALCSAGRVEASRSAGHAFLASHPKSPFCQRIRATCTQP